MKIAILSLILFLVAGASAQGVNSEAQLKKLPSVKYPAEASKTGLEGTVGVGVEVDEKGKVTKVIDVFGPGYVCPNVDRADVVAMRQIASRAAEKAVFIPAIKDGKAVSSQTSINFEFVDRSQRKSVENTGLATVSLGESDESVKSSGTVKAEPNANKATGKLVVETPRMKLGDESAAVIVGKAPPSSTTADTDTISGGVLNGKAISLPKPKYPAAALAIKAVGAVTVQVVIDTNGTIFSAEPLSGHPLLRPASRTAACSSRFTPTLLNGEPVKVSGVIVYNFTR